MKLSISELIREHENLIEVLRSGDLKRIALLADEQERELEQYKKQYKGIRENPSNGYKGSSITKNKEGVVTSLPWVDRIFYLTQKMRLKKVENILKRIPIFKKGKVSSEGKAVEKWLSNSSEFDLYGFIPNISYIRAKDKDKDDLNYLFIHAFGTPTILYAHKKLPFLIVSNPELMSNDSKAYHLNKIPYYKRGKGLHG